MYINIRVKIRELFLTFHWIQKGFHIQYWQYRLTHENTFFSHTKKRWKKSKIRHTNGIVDFRTCQTRETSKRHFRRPKEYTLRITASTVTMITIQFSISWITNMFIQYKNHKTAFHHTMRFIKKIQFRNWK